MLKVSVNIANADGGRLLRGGRGQILVYSRSALLVSFEIDCFYGLLTCLFRQYFNNVSKVLVYITNIEHCHR